MISIKKQDREYVVSYEGQSYPARFGLINNTRFCLIDGIGHFGLDEAHFNVNTDCGICTPEYTGRHKIISAAHKEILKQEKNGKKFVLSDLE